MSKRKSLHLVEVRAFTSQIAKALLYLQSQRVIHRDVSLDNILINQNMDF